MSNVSQRFRRGRVVLLVAVGLIYLKPAAAETADSGSSSPPHKMLEGTAAYRLLAVGLGDMALDEAGTVSGRGFSLEQRLRLEATLRRGNLRVSFSGDVLSGQVAGDTTELGSRFIQSPKDELNALGDVMLRRAMIAWRTPLGELRVGQQVSHWGFGLLANSGEQELPFGDQRLGDLVERVAFFTKPLPGLYAGAGADLVFRDSNAELLEGDVGVNVFAAVFFRLRQHFAGIYGAFRTQWDRDGERLEVGALDIHARTRGRLAFGLGWEAGVEGLLEAGRTSRIRAEPTLEGADLLASGVVARGALAHGPSMLKLTVELGFASGDNDLNDGTIRQIHFHPDYRVGLILFDQYLGSLSAWSADRLADAKHQGQAPHGVAHVPTDGRISNTLYIWPHLAFGPLWGLTLRAGVLWAFSAADVVDPYITNNLKGGYNHNYFGAASGSRDLGLEIQGGLHYRLEILKGLDLGAALQWAHLFPGEAFADSGGAKPSDIDRVAGRLTLTWRFSR